MSPDSRSPIDLSWHPDTYFWPSGLEKQLLAKVKGAARRTDLQRLIDEGRLTEIPDFLATAGLSNDERTEIGKVHPHFMGGEYLPDQDEGEIEIARIEIDSTTGDVTSVYAHQDGAAIRYRVVDEYGGETLQETTERTSTRPLTLGELEEFFLGAWPFLDVLAMNFEDDTEQMLGFFRGESQFYPEFDQLLRKRVIAAYPESTRAAEEVDGEDGRNSLGDREIPGDGSRAEDVVPADPINEEEAPRRMHVLLYSGKLPVDPYGHGHDLTVSASYSVADGLTFRRSDSTQYPLDDLEESWQVEPAHLGDLRRALGAARDEDLLSFLAQRYAEGSMPTHLSGWLDTHGVEYSHVSRSPPN